MQPTRANAIRLHCWIDLATFRHSFPRKKPAVINESVDGSTTLHATGLEGDHGEQEFD